MAFVQEIGHATPISPGSSFAITITNAPSANNLVVLSCAALDPSVSGETVTSVTDGKGNTWTINQTKVSGTSGVAISVASTAQDVGNLTTSDTITVNLSASTASRVAVAAHEISGCTNTVDQATNGVGSTTTRSGGTTATTTNPNDLVWGAFVANAADSGFVPGSGYSVPSPAGFYVNGAMTVEFVYRIVSVTGAYNPNGTGLNTDSQGVAIAYIGLAATQLPTFEPVPFIPKGRSF